MAMAMVLPIAMAAAMAMATGIRYDFKPVRHDQGFHTEQALQHGCSGLHLSAEADRTPCGKPALHCNAIRAVASHTRPDRLQPGLTAAAILAGGINRQTLTVLTWLQKHLSESIRFLAVLWGQPTEKDKEALGCPVLSFDEVIEKGRQNLTGFEANPVQISGSDLATLVYTSGTTGNPKVTAPCYDR